MGVDDESGGNIREIDALRACIGERLVDVTQQDPEEFAEDKQAWVHLHFSNGSIISFPIDDKGFDIETPD